MFLPRTNDCSWRAILVTPTYLCSRMRVATIRGRRGAASIRGNSK